MKNLNISLGLVSTLMMLSACSQESTSLVSQKPIHIPETTVGENSYMDRQNLDWITLDGGEGALDFNPNLDILFVMDNSKSMYQVQSNVIKNLNKFTRGINQYEMIDYHIGVVSVWDSKVREPEAKFQFNPGEFSLGELRPIDGQNGPRFVTREQRNMLSSALALKVVGYDQGGPETEELFSPLAAAIDNTGLGSKNDGFFRADSHLVVVFLTDADDRSPDMTPKDISDKLLAFKGGDASKLSVYGVLVDKSDSEKYKDYIFHVDKKNNPDCFDEVGKKKSSCAKGLGPDRIEEVIVRANAELNRTAEQIKASNILKITSNKFGEGLEVIGNKITAETLRKEIVLPADPMYINGQYQIEVFYGEQKIPFSAKKGWGYDDKTRTVVLDGSIDYKYQEGARFIVRMQPIPQ